MKKYTVNTGRTLIQRVVEATNIDPNIIKSKSEAQTFPGYTTEYMQTLGLSKSDLKKLANKGLALKGYTKNEWKAGEVLPDGKTAQEGYIYSGRGRRLAWVLLGDGS